MRSFFAWHSITRTWVPRRVDVGGVRSTLFRSGRLAGQALVEFALLVSVGSLVIFPIVLGIIDGGRALYTYEAIANAAREGARYCALNLNPSGNAHSGTLTRVQGELSGTGITASIGTNDCATATPAGNPVTVTVSTTFTPVVTNVLIAPIGPITLTSTATMVVWQ